MTTPSSPPPDPSFPNVFEVYSSDYETYIENGDSRKFYRVDPTPLADFVAAAIGLRGDLLECMKTIAEDDQDGPIHLVHLLAACQMAAEDVGGSLPFDGSIPAIFKQKSGFIVASVSPVVFPNLVWTLRNEGIASATNLARTYTRRELFRALDVLVHYVAAPTTNLQIGVEDVVFPPRAQTEEGAVVRTDSSKEKPPRDRTTQLPWWRRISQLLNRSRR